MQNLADPSGRAVYGVGLQSFASWDCWFETRRGHGCLSLVSVVCRQVEVSASASHLSGGFLPSVACLSVIVKPR